MIKMWSVNSTVVEDKFFNWKFYFIFSGELPRTLSKSIKLLYTNFWSFHVCGSKLFIVGMPCGFSIQWKFPIFRGKNIYSVYIYIYIYIHTWFWISEFDANMSHKVATKADPCIGGTYNVNYSNYTLLRYALVFYT